eukprot:3941424-Amphidinium_carterae.1
MAGNGGFIPLEAFKTKFKYAEGVRAFGAPRFTPLSPNSLGTTLLLESPFLAPPRLKKAVADKKVSFPSALVVPFNLLKRCLETVFRSCLPLPLALLISASARVVAPDLCNCHWIGRDQVWVLGVQPLRTTQSITRNCRSATGATVAMNWNEAMLAEAQGWGRLFIAALELPETSSLAFEQTP